MPLMVTKFISLPSYILLIMETSLFRILGFFLICSLLLNCKSPKELLQKGEYEKVLSSLESKAKKGKLSSSDKDLFVKSLNGYLNTGKKKLETNYRSNDPKDWQNGVELLNKFSNRQEKYLAYRQILDKDVTTIDVDKWFVAYGDKLFDYHHARYNEFMADFESRGDRKDVRKAFYEVESMMDYDDGSLNLDSLHALCLELGHREFYVEINNRSLERFNYSYFENDINLRNSDWASFTDDRRADFSLYITLQEVFTEEFVQSDRQRIYTDRVIVGYDAVVDSTGTRQEPIYQNVEATVREVVYVYRVNAVADVLGYEGNDTRSNYDRIFRVNEEDQQIQSFLISGDREAVPSNVPLGNTNQQRRYNYDFLIRDALRELAEEVSFSVQRL